MSTPKAGLSAAGAVVAALLASACCIGPAVLAIAGLGGAASVFTLAPYRSYVLGLSFALLGLAFYFAYRRPRAACGEDGPCPTTPAGPWTRRFLWLATLIIVLLTVSLPFADGRPLPLEAWRARAAAGAVSRRAAVSMTTTMTIRGMTCGGCVARVEERLDRIPGVAGYEVSLERNEARVSYDPATITPEAIAAEVSETGFATAVRGRPAP